VAPQDEWVVTDDGTVALRSGSSSAPDGRHGALPRSDSRGGSGARDFTFDELVVVVLQRRALACHRVSPCATEEAQIYNGPGG
jgi:hypothetical protein